MKRILAAAVGLSGILAACGSAGVAPDGSGSGRIEQMRTEYKLGNTFVACDNISGNGTRNTQTNVAVRFVLSGAIDNVDVSLKGATTSQYDTNFKKNFKKSELEAVDANTYRAVFNANSATGPLLPQSIIISPVPVKVKNVTATNKVGEFYAALTVNTGTSSYSFDGNNFFRVPVYSNCTVTGEMGENV